MVFGFGKPNGRLTSSGTLKDLEFQRILQESGLRRAKFSKSSLKRNRLVSLNPVDPNLDNILVTRESVRRAKQRGFSIDATTGQLKKTKRGLF